MAKKLLLILQVLLSLAGWSVAMEPLKVVFCGFGRTGTHSLGAALDRLGYRALHGEEICVNCLGTHEALGKAVMEQNVDDLLKITSQMGYNATLDVHGLIWRDIRKRLGSANAKYIFIIRDFEPWFESMVAMYETLKIMGRFPVNLIPLHKRIVDILSAVMAQSLELSTEKVLEFFRNGSSTEHYQVQRRVYDEYVKEAHEIVAADPEHALLLNMKDGYPPLCQFLGIEEAACPLDEPFPHLSDRATMVTNLYFLRTIEVVLYVLPAIFLAILWMFTRTFISPLSSKEGKVKQKIN